MNYLNGQFLPIWIPAPAIVEECQPLLPSPFDLWNQIPLALKQNGFGYYMRQYDRPEDMPDAEFYWSYVAHYYYYNRTSDLCSFYDWQGKVYEKTGNYRVGSIYNDAVDWVIDGVEANRLSYAEGTFQLFTRRQLSYYKW